MIRVLHIQETISSGGVERRRLSLAKYLDKSKYNLKIICTKTDGNLADEIRQQGVEVIPIGVLKSPFQWSQHLKVQKIIDDFKPHIIHGAVFEGVTMAAINGFIKKVPIVIIEETSDPINRSWRGNLLMKLYASIAHKVIGVSPAATSYLSKKLKINSKKIQLVLNGIKTPRKVAIEEIIALKNELNILENECVIGSMGRMQLDSHKRFSDLISACAIALNKRFKLKLILVGDGSEKERYKQLVKELEIEENVVFVGYQHDVDLYYSCFDIFALVSAYEAFGLVLAEAMLNKLPVIATQVGGMKYIVENEKTGFLVPPFQPEEIAKKIIQLYQNESLRIEMGAKGYARAKDLYTEERYVKNIHQLYEELLLKKQIKL